MYFYYIDLIYILQSSYLYIGLLAMHDVKYSILYNIISCFLGHPIYLATFLLFLLLKLILHSNHLEMGHFVSTGDLLIIILN